MLRCLDSRLRAKASTICFLNHVMPYHKCLKRNLAPNFRRILASIFIGKQMGMKVKRKCDFRLLPNFMD